MYFSWQRSVFIMFICHCPGMPLFLFSFSLNRFDAALRTFILSWIISICATHPAFLTIQSIDLVFSFLHNFSYRSFLLLALSTILADPYKTILFPISLSLPQIRHFHNFLSSSKCCHISPLWSLAIYLVFIILLSHNISDSSMFLLHSIPIVQVSILYKAIFQYFSITFSWQIWSIFYVANYPSSRKLYLLLLFYILFLFCSFHPL